MDREPLEFSHYLAKHVERLPRSGIRDFFAIVSEMKDAISLGIGEPDFVTPWPIREATIFALERGRTSYTDNRGLLSLRCAIADYVARSFAVQYRPEDEILVGVGVSELLDIALRATLNPGDKVLYHDPSYVSYSPSVKLAHAIPIAVPTKVEDQFALDPDTLSAAWEPGCKLLVLNFPTNPTGGVMQQHSLERIARFAQEKDLLVISDEIYAELTFEGRHVSIASLPGMRHRTLFLNGFSKAFAMTGFRIGYACGPAWFIEGMMKVHQYSIMCASILSQEAATAALKNGADSVVRMKEEYRRRRDYIVRRFNEIGLKCHLPRGAFYAFPSVAESGLDDKTFANRLLQEEKVAVVPGHAFGQYGKGFVRTSYATNYKQLLEAMQRMERFFDKVTAS